MKPYKNEMITDFIKDRNEIVAIHVAMYNMQGSRVIYDGFWTKHQYNIRGELHFGVKFSEKDKAEYSSDTLAMLYKGDFCMGIRHGKGEEYDGHGWLLYQGEFRNNKYHGNGKLFYPMGNVRYEGRFENGKYNGVGKEYDFTGLLKYVGTYVNGEQRKEGSLYLAPHYFQDVGNYGEKNIQMNELHYHRVENCNLEDLNYGDRNEMRYTDQTFELFEKKKLPCCLREPKAYICNGIERD